MAKLYIEDICIDCGNVYQTQCETVYHCQQCIDAGKVSPWQDIATAPRNNTVILGYSHEWGMGFFAWEVGNEKSNVKHFGHSWEFQDIRGNDYINYAPTHWMPPPSRPQAPSEQREGQL